MNEQPSTVGAILTRSARRTPEALALRFGEREWTYAELDTAVSRVAAALRARGLSHSDRVAALGRNSDAFLILYLACARAGLVHVPVNYNAAGDELVHLLTQSEPTCVFIDPTLTDRVAAVADRLGDLWVGTLRDGPADGGDRTGEGPRADPLGPAGNRADVLDWATDRDGAVLEEAGVADDDLVQLLYTSGTTALPKGAMMTHRALVHEYASSIAALAIGCGDVILHSLPLYHSAQMHVFLLPGLAVGAGNHLLEVPSVEAIFATVEAHQVSSLFLPPTVWVDVANHPRLTDAELGSLTKCYYGASIMPVPVLERLRARLGGAGFYNCFGQSEIGPLACVLGPAEHANRPDSVGRPVLFVETRVVDEGMEDVTPGELGEVIYRSPQLCRGYWGNPEATAEAFRGGWFHSGDLVRADAEGYLFVVDRIKDVVNTGGVLVATREVEDALYTHPAVAEAAVIGLAHPRWIEAVAAVVVVRGEVTEAELIEHCQGRLAPHKRPKAVFFAASLPRNASGKLLKRELRDRYAFGDTELAR